MASIFLNHYHKTAIGIEITSKSTKLLELRKRTDKYSVETFAIVKNDVDLSDTESFINSLKNALDIAKPKTKKIAIALNYADVLDKTITISAEIKEEEINEFIKLNSQNYLDLQQDDIFFDYISLPKNSDKNEQKIRIIAAPRKIIASLISLCGKANISLNIVDVNVFCLYRTYKFTCSSVSKSNVHALINVNADSILVCLVNYKEILISKELKTSHDCLHIDTIKHGIKQTLLTCSELINQAINKIIIAGDEISPELINYCETCLNIPCEIIDPFAKMEFTTNVDINNLNKFASSMPVCAGLALHGLGYDQN